MSEQNQDAPAPSPSDPPPDASPSLPAWGESGRSEPFATTPDAPTGAASDFAAEDAARLESERRVARARRGLMVWLVLEIVLATPALLFGQQDAAGLVAFAGLFAMAHAADIDPAWRRSWHLISWVVPVLGMLAFGLLTRLLAMGELTGVARVIAVGSAGTSAVLCMLTGLRPVSNALIRVVFRGAEPNHVRRLAARLVLMGLLVAVPGWFAFRHLFDTLMAHPEKLVESTRLGIGLVGYILLAMGGVGWLVKRDLRETIARLGLERPRFGQIGVVLLGVFALLALNVGGEWVQRTWFHAMWESDQRMNEMLAGSLTGAGVLTLGLTAGIGEEITMRGALQPRLGILLTSLLFASLHVQYSWFGMVIILGLGLALGTLRARTNTTVAILVHAAYDMMAVFASVAAHAR